MGVGRAGSRGLARAQKKEQKRAPRPAQIAISRRTERTESKTGDYAFESETGSKVEIAVESLKISRSQIKSNVPVYEENALDDDLLNEGRRNLLNYVQGLGYFDAKVTVKKNPVSSGEMRVTYNIDAGERHKLVKLMITGNHTFSKEQLRARMQIQAAGRFLEHGRYSQALLNADVRDLIANPYRANGFLEAKITPKVEDNYQGKEKDPGITLQI